MRIGFFQGRQLISGPELDHRMGWHRRTRLRVQKNDPSFPKPVSLVEGGQRLWFEDELEKWMAGRVDRRHSQHAA